MGKLERLLHRYFYGHRWALWQIGDKIVGIYCEQCAKAIELPVWSWTDWQQGNKQGIKISK